MIYSAGSSFPRLRDGKKIDKNRQTIVWLEHGCRVFDTVSRRYIHHGNGSSKWSVSSVCGRRVKNFNRLGYICGVYIIIIKNIITIIIIVIIFLCYCVVVAFSSDTRGKKRPWPVVRGEGGKCFDVHENEIIFASGLRSRKARATKHKRNEYPTQVLRISWAIIIGHRLQMLYRCGAQTV